MDTPNTDITTSGTVICTPKNPASGLNTAEGFMSACEAGTLLVTMGMFFDGTGNNKENTGFTNKPRPEDESKYTSYYNSLSNVARAWKYYRGYINGELVEDNTKINNNDNDGGNLNVYVEGIGTNNLGNDDVATGLALGIDGTSGIIQRVRLGTEKAAEILMGYEKIKNVINTIYKIEVTFDVFGFSRGAAAARHFISLNTKRYPENNYTAVQGAYSSYLEYSINELFDGDRKIEVEIHWRFAGLYETVSSHGLEDLLDFNNDIRELGLDAISNVKSVVQIVAEDEHRKNFSLTTIESAPNGGSVITLPGVHSDIGGGYSNNYKNGTEENYLLYSQLFNSNSRDDIIDKETAKKNINDVKDWFKNNGWYKSDKLIIHEIGDKTGRFELVATRKNIKNTYSYIPLNIMTKIAIENGANFDGNKYDERFFNKYRVYDDIFLGSLLDAFTGSEIDLRFLSNKQLQDFRYEYLHWSSRYRTPLGGNDPRIKDELLTHPKFKRKTIPG